VPQDTPRRHTTWPSSASEDVAPHSKRSSDVNEESLTWDSLNQGRQPTRIFADVTSSLKLKSEHEGQYYPLDEALIPEAFEPWYTNRGKPTGKAVPVDGGGSVPPLPSFVSGCAGLQYEFAQSYYPYVMFRCASSSVLGK
jgi:hypothetical protein